MTANPAIRLYDAPVAALTDAGYAFFLVAALVATWWAGGRNLLYLSEQYQNGWQALVPFWYAVRLCATLVICAVDLWLLAGIVHVLAA